jgi:hypothetical protein
LAKSICHHQKIAAKSNGPTLKTALSAVISHSGLKPANMPKLLKTAEAKGVSVKDGATQVEIAAISKAI